MEWLDPLGVLAAAVAAVWTRGRRSWPAVCPSAQPGCKRELLTNCSPRKPPRDGRLRNLVSRPWSGTVGLGASASPLAEAALAWIKRSDSRQFYGKFRAWGLPCSTALLRNSLPNWQLRFFRRIFSDHPHVDDPVPRPVLVVRRRVGKQLGTQASIKPAAGGSAGWRQP